MDSYVRYGYYTNTYKGSLIPQEVFKKFAIRASNEIRIRIGNKNISKYEEEVQFATCSVADILYNQELIQKRINDLALDNTKIISSEKVGDYSRSYANVSANELHKELNTTKEKIEEVIWTTLFMTGLLYTGIKNV